MSHRRRRNRSPGDTRPSAIVRSRRAAPHPARGWRDRHRLRRRVGRLGLGPIGGADHPAGLPVAPDSCLRARALTGEGFLMLEPEQTTFILLSFEGPDEYSQAGGLGVRVKELSRALAERGFETHLFFVGDPKLPADESALDGRLWLHRWSQWISRHHPVGVYDGEDDKVADLNRSLPDSLVKDYIRPAIERGKTVVVLGEEWHLAHAMSLISDALYFAGLRDRCLRRWNAHNHC